VIGEEKGVEKFFKILAEYTPLDPPENCHLNGKKIAKNLTLKKINFLAIFSHSNGNYPESQVQT